MKTKKTTDNDNIKLQKRIYELEKEVKSYKASQEAYQKMLKKTGESFYIQNNGIINCDIDGNPKQTYCLLHDVSDFRRQTLELYDKLELSNKLLESTPNNIYLFDIKLGKNILPAYNDLEENQFIEHEYRMKHKNGSWRWINSRETIYSRMEDGSPKIIFGIADDISEEKIIGIQFTALLAESEAGKVNRNYQNHLSGMEAPQTYETILKNEDVQLVDIEVNKLRKEIGEGIKYKLSSELNKNDN